jgi:hypothetical protein
MRNTRTPRTRRSHGRRIHAGGRAGLSGLGSPRSVLSTFSVGSILSVGSIFSIGSAGSILSIGSAGSILSIGSAGSILSIGGAGSGPGADREDDEA